MPLQKTSPPRTPTTDDTRPPASLTGTSTHNQHPHGTEARRTAHSAEQTRNLAAPIRRELVGRLTEAGMSPRAVGAMLGVSDMTVRRDTGAANAAPDPLAEEKADGRVVKLTGPGSLLHSEPVERIDYVTGEVLTGEGRNPVPPGVGYPTGAP